MTTSPAPAPVTRFGSFRLGGTDLALPMHSLREVVPCGELIRLPAVAAGLVGGIDLRGVVVPVVDLRSMIGRPIAPIPSPCVVIMVHGGSLLGLLAEAVTRVFTGSEATAAEVRATGQARLLFSQCMHASDGSIVSVLSPEAIARLPGLPMVADAEPARSRPGPPEGGEPGAPAEPLSSLSMMLVRCRGNSFALDAMSVHATLSDLTIHGDTPLAAGSCRGVISYAGARLPAIDLLALCGMGSLDPAAKPQAFVMRFADGMLAVLVDRVMDIRTVERSAVLPLAAFACRSRLIAGVLPAGGAPADPPYFVLDGAAMVADDALAALASTSAVVTVASADNRDAAAVGGLTTSMLTYDLGVETASPLDQIAEILPYGPAAASSGDARGSVMGIVVHRGRSIPLVCLSRLTTGRAVVATASSSVLVVESESDLVGFVVPGLRAIESTRWQPELATIGKPRLAERAGDATRTRLALFQTGAAERMLPVLDLKRLAGSIRLG